MANNVSITVEAGADVITVNDAIASRIKLYRKQKKISLDELSRRANVSKGMLVEIERCKANPSIAILCRLASSLGVSVADFVNVATTPLVHLIDHNNIPVLWKGKNNGYAKLLAGTSGPDMVELWQWELNPNELFESSGHSNGTCELLYVTQGTLTLTVDNTAYVVNEGCSAVARTELPHSYANLSETKLCFTMAVHEKV